MKQTAVEWLMEQISFKDENGFYIIDSLEDVDNLYKKAKEMEKEQIIDAFNSGQQEKANDIQEMKDLPIKKQ